MTRTRSVTRYLTLFIAFCFGAGCSAGTDSSNLPDGVRLIEKVVRAGDEIVIPYEKYLLDNGMTLILHEDGSDPLVHVNVSYHVGSGREEIGKSGFAHFFEHMMFQGSENVADEQHFKLITETGGQLNGTTTPDRTIYYQTVPKNYLERVLWLEADRMGFLLPAVTQEKFEIQRDTVKNERAQSYENRPYGLTFELTAQALYPEGHPYSWLPIGYVEDLNRVNVNDLKAFFLRWYGPNNATLTIGGDFDRDQVLRWVVKYFGGIPAGPDVAPMEKTPVALEADRYVSLEDNVQTPSLSRTTPTVHFGHPDQLPLGVLAAIIGQGQTSLLYKNLTKTQLAVSAQARHACWELACTFLLSVMPTEGHTLADMQRLIDETLAEFEERGVTDDDLERARNGAIAKAIDGLKTVQGKVAYLARMETFTGRADRISAELARYDALTKDDVMRVYETYLKDVPSLFLRVVPKGELDTLVTADNWQFQGRTIPDYDQTQTSETDLAYRTVVDDFDRSVMPASGPPPAQATLESWSDTLPNGIRVLGARIHETPTTAIQLRIRTGQHHETPEKLGVANLTAYMMNEATELSAVEDLSNRLGKLGSAMIFSSNGDYLVLGIGGLTRHLDETLAIAAERLFKPKFAEADFERRHQLALELIRQSFDFPDYWADAALKRLLFGEDNNFSHPGIGREETVQSITLDDIRAFYDTYYSPAATEIAVVSDLPKDEVMAKLAVFADWQGKPLPERVLKPFPELADGTIYLLDKPDAKQSEIRVSTRSVNFDATGEHYRLQLMNYPLGQAFNSRINLNLREDKGYTYGVIGRHRANEYSGRYTIRTAVRNDVTAAAIKEILSEIDGFAKGGMTQAELDFVRSAIGQNHALSYEAPNQKLAILMHMQRHGLDATFPRRQDEILMNVSLEELNALARKHLKADDMIVVVVGAKAQILEDLQGLGRPIVELDATGRPISENS